MIMSIKPGCKLNDWSGKKVGNLIIIERTKKPEGIKSGHVYWKCKCDCGKEIIKPSWYFTKNPKNPKSCGCKTKEKQSIAGKKNLKDISGKRFGKLLVIRHVDKPEGIVTRSTFYECKCDCGNTKIIRREHLTCGRTNSCGCLVGRTKNLPYTPEVIKKRIYSTYIRTAVYRNLDFTISEEEFFNLIASKCYYCGRGPQRIAKMRGKEIPYNGIDRLDNTKGYIKGNYITCCEDCNKAKRMMSEVEFQNLIKLIYNNYILNGGTKYNEKNVSSIGALKQETDLMNAIKVGETPSLITEAIPSEAQKGTCRD
jgi:hypothetical protein